jgi:hypothetical protein
MKFGKNLTAQQAKYHGLRFLDYKELKKIVKLDATDPEFEIRLQSEIEAVNDSFSQHVAGIRAKLQAVAQTTPSSASISSRLREVMHVADAVEVVRRFAVWNAVAVVKILKKRTKALAGPTPPGLGHTDSFEKSVNVPPSCPTESWLGKQLFFSGSDFAELQAGLDSLAEELTRERLEELSGGGRLAPQLQSSSSNAQGDRCPICLEQCVDAVELSSCGHRICWKCCVLGPIAFAPGEYRLSRCSVCRNEQPLDPTKNFKTVCSNKLKVLSELVDRDELVEDFDASVLESGLDVLYGTASGSRNKNNLESEKERQTMESIEACPVSTFFCALCCEPLLLEAVSTTPCKHFFHRVCLEKHAERSCPLCGEVLPVQLVTPRFVHDRLRRLGEITPAWFASPPCERHEFPLPDSRCVNCGLYSLDNLPGTVLVGKNGLRMSSYLHVATRGSSRDSNEDEPVFFSKGLKIRGFSKQVIVAKRKRAVEFSACH